MWHVDLGTEEMSKTGAKKKKKGRKMPDAMIIWVLLKQRKSVQTFIKTFCNPGLQIYYSYYFLFKVQLILLFIAKSLMKFLFT